MTIAHGLAGALERAGRNDIEAGFHERERPGEDKEYGGQEKGQGPHGSLRMARLPLLSG